MVAGEILRDENGDHWQVKDARRACGRGMEALMYPVVRMQSDIELHRQTVDKFVRWHPDGTRGMRFCSPIETSRWMRV